MLKDRNVRWEKPVRETMICALTIDILSLTPELLSLIRTNSEDPYYLKISSFKAFFERSGLITVPVILSGDVLSLVFRSRFFNDKIPEIKSKKIDRM